MTQSIVSFRCAPRKRMGKRNAAYALGALAWGLVYEAKAAMAQPAAVVPKIWHGERAPVCAWPSVVSLEGECSGTLVHPELVLYAAHCGDHFKKVSFGESSDEPAREVPVAYCRIREDAALGEGNDFAYCRLTEAQDVPIVPILDGCEIDALQLDLAVTLVGFGLTELGQRGQKHQAQARIACLTRTGEALLGGREGDTCAGDSGGPAFARLGLEPNSWRLIGVTSYGAGCGDGGYYALAQRAVDWLEHDSGLMLSGCGSAATHDSAFVCELPGGHERTDERSWANSCAPPTRASEFPSEATCPSTSYALAIDVDPPLVRLLSMPRGDVVAGSAGVANIEVIIEVADTVGGCGVRQVHVEVDGAERAPRSIQTGEHSLRIALVPGAHDIAIWASDLGSNLSKKAQLTVRVVRPSRAQGCAIGVTSGAPALPGWPLWAFWALLCGGTNRVILRAKTYLLA